MRFAKFVYVFVVVVCVHFSVGLPLNAEAQNWNNGSQTTNGTLISCMSAGVRNFESVITYNPELFIKLMGRDAIPSGFKPETTQQRLFVKLADQHNRRISPDDKRALLKIMTPDCDYQGFRHKGKVFALMADLAEQQERALRQALSRQITYGEAGRLMSESSQLDVERFISQVSAYELEQFMRDFENFSMDGQFDKEIQRILDIIVVVFRSYDMEFAL